MKNLKSVIAVMGMGLVIGLAGCEKKDEPGPRDVKLDNPPIKIDVKETTETNKEAASEAAKQAVTDAEAAAKKAADEAAKKASGGN